MVEDTNLINQKEKIISFLFNLPLNLNCLILKCITFYFRCPEGQMLEWQANEGTKFKALYKYISNKVINLIYIFKKLIELI